MEYALPYNEGKQSKTPWQQFEKATEVNHPLSNSELLMDGLLVLS
jgi:hypothetical protein